MNVKNTPAQKTRHHSRKIKKYIWYVISIQNYQFTFEWAFDVFDFWLSWPTLVTFKIIKKNLFKKMKNKHDIKLPQFGKILTTYIYSNVTRDFISQLSWYILMSIYIKIINKKKLHLMMTLIVTYTKRPIWLTNIKASHRKYIRVQIINIIPYAYASLN